MEQHRGKMLLSRLSEMVKRGMYKGKNCEHAMWKKALCSLCLTPLP